MNPVLKKLVIALTVVAILGAGVRESSAIIAPPLPGDPVGLAILGVFSVVVLLSIAAAQIIACSSEEPADAGPPAPPYDPDCLKSEAGATGCLPPHAPPPPD